MLVSLAIIFAVGASSSPLTALGFGSEERVMVVVVGAWVGHLPSMIRHVADHTRMVHFFAIFIHQIIGGDALAILDLAVLALARWWLIMRVRLQEVIHICPLLAWSWRLLGVAVMAPKHVVFVLERLLEVVGVHRGSSHEVIWILSISSINIVCCITSILHKVGLIASRDGVLAHTCHSCCHVFVSASLFAEASALILHASVLMEAVVFLLA